MALQIAMERVAAQYGGRAAGPFTLVMIAFGVDPMTGRAAALANGHGFVTGWAIAIAGDMLLLRRRGVHHAAAERLHRKDPEATVLIVLAAMIVVPLVIRR